ncbi:MAG: hypothetical protein WKF75_12250 [Singulisphaera sp.]
MPRLVAADRQGDVGRSRAEADRRDDRRATSGRLLPIGRVVDPALDAPWRRALARREAGSRSEPDPRPADLRDKVRARPTRPDPLRRGRQPVDGARDGCGRPRGPSCRSWSMRIRARPGRPDHLRRHGVRLALPRRAASGSPPGDRPTCRSAV